MVCITCASVGVVILSLIAYKLWKDRQARLEEERKKKQLLHQRTLRTADSAPDNEELTCIVCLSKRREVVLLPCGHICLCYDCSVQLCHRPCPVCQQNVTDVHLVFIPWDANHATNWGETVSLLGSSIFVLYEAQTRFPILEFVFCILLLQFIHVREGFNLWLKFWYLIVFKGECIPTVRRFLISMKFHSPDFSMWCCYENLGRKLKHLRNNFD